MRQNLILGLSIFALGASVISLKYSHANAAESLKRYCGGQSYAPDVEIEKALECNKNDMRTYNQLNKISFPAGADLIKPLPYPYNEVMKHD